MSDASEWGDQALRVEYSSVGGKLLGLALHERESHLRLDAGRNEVTLERHRSESDGAGEPIGTFRAQLQPDWIQNLAAIAARVRLAELPAPTGGGIGTTSMTILIDDGASRTRKTLTSRDIPLIQQIRPLLIEFNRLTGMMLQYPERAVRAAVAYSATDHKFVFTLTNIGTQAVCVSDPRLLKGSNPMQWAGVRVAEFPEERPGVTAAPLEWVTVKLAGGREAGASDSIALKPGESFTAPTQGWQPVARGVRYLAQAVFSNYAGPKEVAGCYRIRGAVFSAGLEFTSP